MGDQNLKASQLWEHTLTNLLGLEPTSEPGTALRLWVHHQSVQDLLDLFTWEQEEFKTTPTQHIYSIDDQGQALYLRTNQIKHLGGLITYMKHVYHTHNPDPASSGDFSPFTLDQWSQHTSTMFRAYLIQHLANPIGPEPVPSGPISSSRPTGYSPAAIELMGFKKGIKREISA